MEVKSKTPVHVLNNPVPPKLFSTLSTTVALSLFLIRPFPPGAAEVLAEK